MLAAVNPLQFLDALDMEFKAMEGMHSRWDEQEVGISWAEAIHLPEMPKGSSTIGLGRNKSWNHFARATGICAADGSIQLDRNQIIEIANFLFKKGGGNAADGRITLT